MSANSGPPPLFDAAVTDRLRAAAEARYRIGDIHTELGPGGQTALDRCDLAGVELSLSESPTASLVRLFLLGLPVENSAAAAALRPLGLSEAVSAGLLAVDGAGVRATVDFRPYAETAGDGWWVMSDQSVDVSPEALAPDHVLGVGAAATTLAQAVIRDPVRTAADIGTGCGVQALHLSRHAEQVIATDISVRALAMAAVNARLNGMTWTLRHGSLLDPLDRQTVDLLVCNPPFIVGPGFTGAGGHLYRDSGMAGDEVSRRLVTGIAGALAEGGTGQLLANWVLTGDQPWEERVGGWLAGSGCDAWVWQRELLEPGEYVGQWLRDAGDRPGSPTWRGRYRGWVEWFGRAGVAAVGMGLVSIRRTGTSATTVVCEDLRQAVCQPIGPTIRTWFDIAAWLRERDDRGLLASRVRACDGLAVDSRSWLSETGWQAAGAVLTQTRGACWQIEADDAVTQLVAGCDGSAPIGVLLELLDLQPVGHDAVSAVAALVRDLVQRGFLRPAD